jgi:hypothetical protein
VPSAALKAEKKVRILIISFTRLILSSPLTIPLLRYI